MGESTLDTVMDLAADAVDVAEVASAEFPLVGPAFHSGKAQTKLFDAACDHVQGDDRAQTHDLQDAGMEAVKMVPFLGLVDRMLGVDDDRMRARMYGDSSSMHRPATRESIREDDARQLEEGRRYRAEHPEDSVDRNAPHHDPADVAGLYELQRWKYQLESSQQHGAHPAMGPAGYPLTPEAPDYREAQAESDTMLGHLAATGYNAVAPALNVFGIEPD